ncbi:hypothetical protein JTB14_002143 [Gonioctena quinquepunctata]|nr:hypothetical protein JTB14_002143 [Gonioctena quinquepunctata]
MYFGRDSYANNKDQNWTTWKYKFCILLQGIPGAIDVIEGRIGSPTPTTANASVEDKSKNESDLAFFTKADGNALLIMTTDMTKKTLQKVMRFSIAREVELDAMAKAQRKIDDLTNQLCAHEKALLSKSEHNQKLRW